MAQFDSAVSEEGTDHHAKPSVAELAQQPDEALRKQALAKAKAAAANAGRDVTYAVRATLQSRITVLTKERDDLAHYLARIYQHPRRPIKQLGKYGFLKTLAA